MNLIILKTITFIVLFNTFTFSNWQWVSSGLGGNYPVQAITSFGNYIYAGTNLFSNGSMYYSTNFGSQWHNMFTNNADVLAAVSDDSFVYLATDKGIFRTKNLGQNWEHCLNNNHVFSSIITVNSASTILTCCYDNGNGKIFLSNDFGVTWTQTLSLGYEIVTLFKTENVIYAGTNGAGVYKSTNNGLNWSQTPLYDENVNSITAYGSTVFAGTMNNGVLKSTDYGQTWSRSLNITDLIFTVAAHGNYIFAGVYEFKNFYYSSNNGQSWSHLNSGILDPAHSSVRTIHIAGDYIYIGVSNSMYNGVYRRPLSEIISVQPISTNIPNHFSLSQNYPNPFNPVTKIKFDISGTSASQTFLSVYDIMGREVEILVNEMLKPGKYEVDWNAVNYTSGVYYYKITSGDFSETRKMVLVK